MALVRDLFSLDLAEYPYLCVAKPAQPHIEPCLVMRLLRPSLDVVSCDLCLRQGATSFCCSSCTGMKLKGTILNAVLRISF